MAKRDIKAATPKSVAVGSCHACVSISDGTVRCWGHPFPQLKLSGSPSVTPDGHSVIYLAPSVVQGLTNIVRIALSASHGCAIKADKTALCWGDNMAGELGSGNSAPVSPPEAVQLSNVAQIAVSVSGGSQAGPFTCALQTMGTLDCWGANVYGQLGIGKFDSISHPTPTQIPGMVTAIQMATGDGLACAVLGDRTISCWGANPSGTGDCAGPACNMRPTKVLGIGAAMEVAVGAVHACARLMAGTVACWGGNTFGQLGNGSTANALSPQNVAGLSGVVQLASGDFFTCALKSDGSVWCWGNNDGGQLGNGLTVDSPWPVQVPEVSGATQIAAFGERFLSGGCANVCVLQQDRSVQCWGDNSFGQIGSGTISAGPMPPTLVVW